MKKQYLILGFIGVLGMVLPPVLHADGNCYSSLLSFASRSCELNESNTLQATVFCECEFAIPGSSQPLEIDRFLLKSASVCKDAFTQMNECQKACKQLTC